MWLSKRFNKPKISVSEVGTVTNSNNSTINTSSTVSSNGVLNYSPYGYSFSAPKGEEVLLINSSLGTVGAGIKMKNENLSSGEIAISSIGGAKIILKNDGTVFINGIIINKEGCLLNKRGEIIIE